jgi:hypothetical protein
VFRDNGWLEEGEPEGVAFLFPVKGRRNDQSDSNWTESNSDAMGEKSSSVVSRS